MKDSHLAFDLSAWLFSEKIHFATPSKVQIITFDCFKLFLKEFGCLFITRMFQTNLYQILSVGFRFLGPGISVFIKKRFYFDFSLMSLCKTFLPVIRRACFDWSSALYRKRERTNLLDFPFWNSAFKPNRRKYLSKISSTFKNFFVPLAQKIWIHRQKACKPLRYSLGEILKEIFC